MWDHRSGELSEGVGWNDLRVVEGIIHFFEICSGIPLLYTEVNCHEHKPGNIVSHCGSWREASLFIHFKLSTIVVYLFIGRMFHNNLSDCAICILLCHISWSLREFRWWFLDVFKSIHVGAHGWWFLLPIGPRYSHVLLPASGNSY